MCVPNSFSILDYYAFYSEISITTMVRESLTATDEAEPLVGAFH